MEKKRRNPQSFEGPTLLVAPLGWDCFDKISKSDFRRNEKSHVREACENLTSRAAIA